MYRSEDKDGSHKEGGRIKMHNWIARGVPTDIIFFPFAFLAVASAQTSDETSKNSFCNIGTFATSA